MNLERKLIKSAAKQILYCVVAEPGTEDLQGDVWPDDEIEKAAHGYMLDSGRIGSQHAKNSRGMLIEVDAGVVESFIAPADFEVGEEKIRKGSWVIAIKVRDPEMWNEVESGEITGVSIGGIGERHEAAP